MKCLKFIIFAFILLICHIANAEVRYVNTSVLNLRSCPSTECEISGKLVSGETVYVEETQDEWAKVRTDKGNGYVVKRSLADHTSHYTPYDSEDHPILTLLFFIFAICIAWFIYMLPATLAQNNKNAARMYKVNLFLGWIPGVWPILLILALVGERVDE